MTDVTRREALGILGLAAAGLGLAGCAGGSGSDGGATGDAQDGSSSDADTTTGSADYIDSVDADDPYGTGVHTASIEVADYGTIELSLNANVAPISVSNFCHLAADGFYDGLTFHRIISGFMIQGGDPNGDGTGGSGKNIKGEFQANGVANNIPHVRGTISMARASDYNSASSQFFIVHQTSDTNSQSLDGQYAAFGSVTSGMEVVDAICKNVPVEDSNGTVAKDNQPVITKVTVAS